MKISTLLLTDAVCCTEKEFYDVTMSDTSFPHLRYKKIFFFPCSCFFLAVIEFLGLGIEFSFIAVEEVSVIPTGVVVYVCKG